MGCCPWAFFLIQAAFYVWDLRERTVKTDALFYRLFKEWPECFFELIGRPASDARRYRFDAVELKDTAARIDGFYAPVRPNNDEPVFFVEFQNYKSDRTYSNLFLKIGLYLE